MEKEIESVFFVHYENDFNAIKIIDNFLLPTKINIDGEIVFEDYEKFSMEEFNEIINVSLAKLNYFVENVLNNSLIFMYKEDFVIRNLYDNNYVPIFRNNFVLTPEMPSDLHLAVLFKSKFTALCDKNLYFGYFSISSNRISNSRFTYLGDNNYFKLPLMKDWVGDFSYFDKPWWERDDASTLDVIPSPDSDLSVKPDFAYSILDRLNFENKNFVSKNINNQPRMDNIIDLKNIKPKRRK